MTHIFALGMFVGFIAGFCLMGMLAISRVPIPPTDERIAKIRENRNVNCLPELQAPERDDEQKTLRPHTGRAWQVHQGGRA